MWHSIRYDMWRSVNSDPTCVMHSDQNDVCRDSRLRCWVDSVQRVAAGTMTRSPVCHRAQSHVTLQETIRCTVLSLDNIFYIFSSLSASCACGQAKMLLFHFLVWIFCVSGFCFANLLSFSLSVVDFVSFRSLWWVCRAHVCVGILLSTCLSHRFHPFSECFVVTSMFLCDSW